MTGPPAAGRSLLRNLCSLIIVCFYFSRLLLMRFFWLSCVKIKHSGTIIDYSVTTRVRSMYWLILGWYQLLVIWHLNLEWWRFLRFLLKKEKENISFITDTISELVSLSVHNRTHTCETWNTFSVLSGIASLCKILKKITLYSTYILPSWIYPECEHWKEDSAGYAEQWPNEIFKVNYIDYFCLPLMSKVTLGCQNNSAWKEEM